jgi:hypothetical protein
LHPEDESLFFLSAKVRFGLGTKSEVMTIEGGALSLSVSRQAPGG